jgi:hypothetical protein
MQLGLKNKGLGYEMLTTGGVTLDLVVYFLKKINPIRQI